MENVMKDFFFCRVKGTKSHVFTKIMDSPPPLHSVAHNQLKHLSTSKLSKYITQL